jgi:hypothetical protein
MVRTIKWLAGGVFSLSVATLVPFLAEKGTEPKGHAVLWVLYGLVAVSAFTWQGTTLIGHFKTAGGPKPLEINYSLDGSSEMRIPFRCGRPQRVLISVGLKNPNPFNLEGVAINSLFPQGLQVERCGAHGEPLDNPRGHWLSAPERLPDEPPSGTHKDYWADENVTIAGNGSKVLFFKLRIAQPGTIYLLTRIFGNVPERQQATTLEVIETEDMLLVGIVNELIHDGEALANSASIKFGGDPKKQRWREELIFATAALDDEDRKCWEVATQGAGQSPSQIVPILYDLRRRIDWPAQES